MLISAKRVPHPLLLLLWEILASIVTACRRQLVKRRMAKQKSTRTSTSLLFLVQLIVVIKARQVGRW
jgi:hypothetical protein